MNMFRHSIFSVLLLLIAGATFGPVLFAVIASTFDAQRTTHPNITSNEHSRLVEAYRARLPANYLFLSIVPPEDGKECGYSPDDVFPNSYDELEKSGHSQTYTHYAGYWVLDRWRNKTRDEEWISAITENMRTEVSDFEAGFLRRCIEATVFSSLCMEEVSSFGETAERFDHNREAWPLAGYGIEDEIVCTFVDGVAARRGIPLKEIN